MEELTYVIGVVALFFVRIGIPVLLLVTIGVLIDRWQTRREQEIDRQYSVDLGHGRVLADDAPVAEIIEEPTATDVGEQTVGQQQRVHGHS